MSDTVNAKGEATLWGLFEVAMEGPGSGNPFQEVELSAVFRQGDEERHVTGFYDGDGIYRLRFMPEVVGEWTYETASNVDVLNGIRGTVSVGPAKPGDHGPVRVANRHHFRYADGTRYINVGTTAYAWNHQSEALQEETLATLAEAPFTKIRMCVFPKHYRYNETEPDLYPFPLLKKGESRWRSFEPVSGWEFDFERVELTFFRHLEKRIADLAAIGVEADLIIFHPYDRWGFSRMTPGQDDRYLRYLVARLAAFPNVWWSMANEYDLMPSKSLADWERFIEIVADTDPHGHLLSVHNCFGFYDHDHPRITHASIQRPDPARSALWRHQYGKPVSIDECCYEGDIAEAWGNISGLELVHRFWEGAVNGGYVTHGETFYDPTETLWWAKGGTLRGESTARIAFLRRILEEGPDDGLDPDETTGPYRIMLGGGMDAVSLQALMKPPEGQEEQQPRLMTWFATGCQPHRYYLTYFGQNQPHEFAAAVPSGERYSATLIDTWGMKKTPLSEAIERGHLLQFPPKPYQALLLQRTYV